MRKSILGLSALLMSVAATPALAQDEEPAEAIKITGSAGLVSDYRFRGFSQNSEDAAIQGGLTATHESGFYVGTWGSSISFAGHTEVDIFAGYATEITPGVTLDAGLLYYLYPKHGDYNTDFFEPYVNLSGTVGPVSLKVGANYAWKQSALIDASGSKADAIYLHVEPTIAIPETPFALVGHAGWAKSDAFPGGPDGETFDYSLGATLTYKMLTFGVSYVNTDVSKTLGKEAIGADGAVIFSIGAAF
jgi:uncharacterized protein (TIGR02001 family)